MSRFERDGAAQLQRPRRGRRGRARRRAAGAVLRRLDPRRGGADRPRDRPRHRRGGRRADRVDRRPAAARRTPSTSSPAASRPTPSSAAAASTPAATAAGGERRVPPVTADAFDPAAIGAAARRRRRSSTRCSSPATRSRRRSTPSSPAGSPPTGVEVIRDPHLGTGISNSALVDWGELSTAQVADDEPDAVVVFIGANEGYGMPGPDGEEVECCGADYAAVYANRVRQVMDTYRQDGAAKVYWLTVMTPRDPDAAAGHASSSTPRSGSPPSPGRARCGSSTRCRSSPRRALHATRSTSTAQETIVRESDGIHLNADGLVDRRRPGPRPRSTRTSSAS